MDQAFQTLIEGINAQLEVLKRNGYTIHDAANLEVIIAGVRYDNEDDMIKVDFQEE